MKYDLIIDSRPSEVVIALLRDGLLIELHKEKRDNNFSAGDIYLGKVRKTNPGLNASFVSVGYEKDGFLHYSFQIMEGLGTDLGELGLLC